MSSWIPLRDPQIQNGTNKDRLFFRPIIKENEKREV